MIASAASPAPSVFAFASGNRLPPVGNPQYASASDDARGYNGIKRFDKRVVGVVWGEYAGDLDYGPVSSQTPAIGEISSFLGGLPSEFNVSNVNHNVWTTGTTNWSIVRMWPFWVRIKD